MNERNASSRPIDVLCGDADLFTEPQIPEIVNLFLAVEKRRLKA
jgi:hypothetical protein